MVGVIKRVLPIPPADGVTPEPAPPRKYHAGAATSNQAWVPDPRPAWNPLAPLSQAGLEADLGPLLGEFAWHSLTLDPSIDEMSVAHCTVVTEVLKKHFPKLSPALRALEVGAYAHTTGYQLSRNLGVRSELLDISASNLRLGLRLARKQGLPVYDTARTAADFHALPYEDDQFDLVYICSSLHHTWRWQQVLSELVRVLAPGGILFLENEPCRRDFCFYRFRTNRPDRFTPFERKLEELGIIRTVAEPYLGSRPETLFGMVENQAMPLDRILEAVSSRCTILGARLTTESCMGRLEQAMVERRKSSAADCARWLASTLTDLAEQARGALTDRELRLGFDLPSGEEIRSLSAQAAQALTNLPSRARSWEFRMRLSQLFGSPVRLTARKDGARRATAGARLKKAYPQIDDVVMAYSPQASRLLDPSAFLLPDIQTADPEMMARNFPVSDWKLAVSPENLRALVAAAPEPRLSIAVPRAGHLVLLIRISVAFGGRPYRVTLSSGGRELSSFAVYQEDSLLLSAVVPCDAGTPALWVSVRAIPLEGDALPAGSFTISYAGAFIL
jgi:SAM-dependent methyltransferase